MPVSLSLNPSQLVRDRAYRVRSNHPLDPAMATDWSITHSPTPRYLSTHFDISLLSPATLSVLKLGLDSATVSFEVCRCCALQVSSRIR